VGRKGILGDLGIKDCDKQVVVMFDTATELAVGGIVDASWGKLKVGKGFSDQYGPCLRSRPTPHSDLSLASNLLA